MKCLIHSLLIFLSLLLTACSINPVTGERQLMFSSFSEDVQIGEQQYEPTLQAQGGSYVVDPALNQYVSQVGLKLAKVSDVPKLPYEFTVLNNSVPNAWALPSGKIAINRGLLVKLENESQLAAVLSHEIVHAAARHSAQQQRNNMLIQAGIAGLGFGLKNNDYSALIIGGAGLGAQLAMAKYSRVHELESDHYGMQYMAKAGYDLQGAVELQQLFVELSKNRESSWLEGLFASHPPSQERVDENIKHTSTYGIPNGFIGKREYQNALAYLSSKQKAYDLADQAIASLSKGDSSEALRLINQALEIEPKEALFHQIKGDSHHQSGEFKSALASHQRATNLNPRQFSYFLKRAQSYAALNQYAYAIDDFKYSMRLLPTSLAAYELGELYAQQDNQSMAVKYYSQAAESQGEIAQNATKKLAIIEIHQQPEKYLKAKHFQDPKGPLLVTIENHSPLNISQLSLQSQLIDSQGRVINKEDWQTSEPIPAQKRSRYYPAKVTYHLKQGESVRTIVTDVKLVNKHL